jgi:hypothetical protein
MIAKQRRRSTASRRNPEVVVAIDFIAGDREDRAQKEFASVASLLKRYLEHPCVLRKPSDSQWPNLKALARMSRANQVRWGAMQQQAQIDSLLSRVLKDERLESIFKLDRGPRGNPGHGGRGGRGGRAWNSKRDTWMLCEVLWLMDREHVSRVSSAKLGRECLRGRIPRARGQK